MRFRPVIHLNWFLYVVWDGSQIDCFCQCGYAIDLKSLANPHYTTVSRLPYISLYSLYPFDSVNGSSLKSLNTHVICVIFSSCSLCLITFHSKNQNIFYLKMITFNLTTIIIFIFIFLFILSINLIYVEFYILLYLWLSSLQNSVY